MSTWKIAACVWESWTSQTHSRRSRPSLSSRPEVSWEFSVEIQWTFWTNSSKVTIAWQSLLLWRDWHLSMCRSVKQHMLVAVHVCVLSLLLKQGVWFAPIREEGASQRVTCSFGEKKKWTAKHWELVLLKDVTFPAALKTWPLTKNNLDHLFSRLMSFVHCSGKNKRI